MTSKTLDDIQDMPTLEIIAAVRHATRVGTLLKVAEDQSIPLDVLCITLEDIAALDMGEVFARHPPDSDWPIE